VEGESLRKKLLERGLLDVSLIIRSEDDHLLLPVVDPSPVEDMELVLEDFEERDLPETDYRNLLDLPPEKRALLPMSYDVVGDIAILRLPDELLDHSVKIGEALMSVLPRLRTVTLDKGVHGEFRVRQVEVICGEDSTITTHTEFGLRFRVDVARVYFNPRLAGERRRVSSLVREGETVVDMFAGVGPFSIMMARYASPEVVHAIDLNPAAVQLMRENIDMNRVEGIVPIEGDARSIMGDLPEADRIVMNLPHSAHEFLDEAAMSLRSEGTIHLYIISERTEVDRLMDGIISDLRSKGIDLDVARMEELKTYSPTMSVYSLDLVLTHRPCSRARA
jgi:tRNA (guanine37-N1)-methyltransferase